MSRHRDLFTSSKICESLSRQLAEENRKKGLKSPAGCSRSHLQSQCLGGVTQEGHELPGQPGLHSNTISRQKGRFIF